MTMAASTAGTQPTALAVSSAPTRRTIGGYIWFALMIGGWSLFFVLALFSESTLDELWLDLRDLPLLVEGLVWLLLFPLVLATAVWESSWETWLRLLLVGCFTVGWSFAFWPRRGAGPDRAEAHREVNK